MIAERLVISTIAISVAWSDYHDSAIKPGETSFCQGFYPAERRTTINSALLNSLLAEL